MGGLADRVAAMCVRAEAPGGVVGGELRGRGEVDVWFAPDAYARCDEPDLERHLAHLAALLWVGRARAYANALRAAGGGGEPPPVGRRDLEFRAAREDLVAEGVSTDGSVCLAVRGMRDWSVRIADGTLRSTRPDELAHRVGEAAAALVRDQVTKIVALRVQCFDGPPPQPAPPQPAWPW